AALEPASRDALPTHSLQRAAGPMPVLASAPRARARVAERAQPEAPVTADSARDRAGADNDRTGAWCTRCRQGRVQDARRARFATAPPLAASPRCRAPVPRAQTPHRAPALAGRASART